MVPTRAAVITTRAAGRGGPCHRPATGVTSLKVHARTIVGGLAPLVAALALAGSAGAVEFGITDDTGKYADDKGASFFSTLNDLGMTENRVTVLWDPAN